MKKEKIKSLIINALIFIILPVIINLILDSFGSKDILGGLKKLIYDPYVFLCNTLIIASTLSVGVFLKRFRSFWITITSVVWITLGGINYIILCNRILPFTIYDLYLLDTFPFIMRKYLSPLLMAVFCLIIVTILLGIVILFFRALALPKQKFSFKAPLAYFLIIISLTCGNLQFAIHSGALQTNFTELSKSFVTNGFAYSFMTGIFDSGVSKVDGYSQKLIRSITHNFDVSQTPAKTPNIIFLQMESFFDVNALKNVEFSENPIPNFTKFSNENPSGLLTVPVIGAGTANTEFEVMTGMRTADFGAGEYPFKTILTKTTCESIATNLKNHGYTSHFMHNYKGGFYGRNKVYANLGYDNFYSIEYMTDYEKNENDWAKDKILLRYINESLDATEGSDLITAISVQAHGTYSGITDFKRHITVTECDDKNLTTSYEYYVNQIYEMDQFLGELMESISQRDEETILVIYGDHLPSLEIKDSDLSGRSIYQTDYFIWNNLGIEYKSQNLSAYQLSSYILEKLNITDGIINSCHQQYKGNKDYLFNLQALEYDTLYGNKYAYNKKNPYPVSEMKVNCRKMQINTITKKENSDNTYIIHGSGFSPETHVRIAYTITSTTYIDENTLEFKCEPKDAYKPISVWEHHIGNSKDHFITFESDK